jgi:hypothetical protein
MFVMQNRAFRAFQKAFMKIDGTVAAFVDRHGR